MINAAFIEMSSKSQTAGYGATFFMEEKKLAVIVRWILGPGAHVSLVNLDSCSFCTLTCNDLANGWVAAGLWRTREIVQWLRIEGIIYGTSVPGELTIEDMMSDLRKWTLEILEEVALHQVSVVSIIWLLLRCT